MAASQKLDCILVADDLTGACDTLVHFAQRGLCAEVRLDLTDHINAADVEVLAFNTDSRSDSSKEATRKLRQVAINCAKLSPAVLFKKVDSVFRGNTALEIRAALDCFGRKNAVIAPSYPAMQRIVRDGILHWKDCSTFGSLDIVQCLRDAGIRNLSILSAPEADVAGFERKLASALRSGKNVLVDSVSQDHLRTLVGAITSFNQILWVGSAGLGIALASTMESHAYQPVRTMNNRSVLFCIGSTHNATEMQRIALSRSGISSVRADRRDLGIALRALSLREDLVVILEHKVATEAAVREFFCALDRESIEAILMTGGDTASLVCRALSAGAIRLCGEVSPGIPSGRLQGGRFAGTTVATKSGAFGGPESLLLAGKALRKNI
jgi:D-threonate/D-erythronate kinase